MDNSSFSWERFERGPPFNRSRHQRQPDAANHAELFVFGYSCKLYRDDEKFRWINSCQHLIPWMGHENLLVDRYDVRGYLNDLGEFDRKHERQQSCTNDQEEDFESRLNEERFADLKSDDSPEPDNHVRKQYSQVNYHYDQVAVENEATIDEKSTDNFKAPHGLVIPSNIIVPKTNKLHCVIEKTALFVAQQGSQMEILLKTKQASNSNFNFLSMDSELNPYYKFILGELKSGKYAPKEGNGQIESDSDSDDDNYLHPSLLSSQKGQHHNKLDIKNLFTSKPENDSYSQLVKHFKDKFAEDILQDNSNSEKSSDSTNSQSAIISSVSSLLPQPPPEVELIITKLAQHVAKNGEDFESSIKALNDKKFDFLNPGHIYHPYYVKQKIHYLSETKHKQKKNSEKIDSGKLIAFSISSKDNSKMNCLVNSELTAKELSDDYSKPTSSLASESTQLSKEKQLQEERKRKTMEFLKMMRKENKIEDHQSVYGPNLPKPNDSVRLSPTIAEVTSPTHSPTSKDYEIQPNKESDKKNTSGALLPFTSNDNLIKNRSLSPIHRKTFSHSPPRRYRVKEEESPHKNKKKSKYRSRDRKSSRKHRYRSRSRSKERRRSRSSKHGKSKRSSHRRSASSSRSSRSRSRTPRGARRHKSKRHSSHQSKSRSRSRS